MTTRLNINNVNLALQYGILEGKMQRIAKWPQRQGAMRASSVF